MRRRRRDAGLVRLSERDLFALRVVGEQYAVRLSLLSDILTVHDGAPVTPDAARKVAARWHRARIAEIAPILAGQGSHAWLTPYGLDQVGLTYKPWVPSAVGLPHADAVTAVRIALEALPEGRWVSERTLRQGISRSAGSTTAHLPDGELQGAFGRVAIEVELTAKTVERTRRILAGLTSRRGGYTDDEEPSEGLRYSQVRYFTSAAARSVVEQAKARLPDDLAGRVRIEQLAELPWPR
jgi:hypothetical protein